MARQKAIVQMDEDEITMVQPTEEGGKIAPNKLTNEPELSELPGVGPATAEKLVAAGFSTVLSIAFDHNLFSS